MDILKHTEKEHLESGNLISLVGLRWDPALLIDHQVLYFYNYFGCGYKVKWLDCAGYFFIFPIMGITT